MVDNAPTTPTQSPVPKFEIDRANEKCSGTSEASLASELVELRRQLRLASSSLDNIGTINPRPPGLHNDAIQLIKRLIARSLNWYIRPIRECLAAVIASLNEIALIEQAHDHQHVRSVLLGLSQRRWKGSEPDAGLTWGQIFTGDSFIDAVQAFYHFDPTHHICEVGPGYGRLLRTILERKLPFRRYTGLELSGQRVTMLRGKFVDPRVEFVEGDINQAHFEEKPDLVICSSTFEHLFPDFTAALRNISNQLKPLGCVAIDYVQADPSMEQREQGFEPEGDAFVRIYSKEEIQGRFRACGLSGLQVRSIVLGRASYGDINRIFVFARRGADLATL